MNYEFNSIRDLRFCIKKLTDLAIFFLQRSQLPYPVNAQRKHFLVFKGMTSIKFSKIKLSTS